MIPDKKPLVYRPFFEKICAYIALSVWNTKRTFEKEDIAMSHLTEKANHCIECHVTQCGHHCGCEDYCSLDRICVGTHEANPTIDQCTDCMSFVKK